LLVLFNALDYVPSQTTVFTPLNIVQQYVHTSTKDK